MVPTLKSATGAQRRLIKALRNTAQQLISKWVLMISFLWLGFKRRAPPNLFGRLPDLKPVNYEKTDLLSGF
ncbi:hypothetical protein MASR2M41_20170 [Flammeovirgaceae bacterium]